MNARQKAKYYKRKCEQYENMPLPNVTIQNVYTETLKVAKFYPDCFFNDVIKDNPNLMKHELTIALSKEIEKYVHIETMKYDGFPSGHMVKGSVTIAIYSQED